MAPTAFPRQHSHHDLELKQLTESVGQPVISQKIVTHSSKCHTDLVMRRRGRQLWLMICLTFFICFIALHMNTGIWETLKGNGNSLDQLIPSIGFRKLLEEEQLSERMRLKGMEQRLPHCIIFGVRKCGTRALLEFLKLHPGIRVSEHEMHFFDDDNNYSRGVDWYLKNMPYSYPNQLTIEKTPRYFIAENVPKRIFFMNNTVKLIVIFRHPTIRAISDYTQVFSNKVAKNKTFSKFEEIAINPDTGKVNTAYRAIQISLYHNHFSRWLSIFPREQIHVVDGDKLISEPVTEIEKIENFLNLEHQVTSENLYYNATRGFYCMRNSTAERCLGATKGRKHPDIDPGVVMKLNRFFRPHNKKLFEMINFHMSWE